MVGSTLRAEGIQIKVPVLQDFVIDKDMQVKTLLLKQRKP